MTPRFDWKTGLWIEPQIFCEYGSEFLVYAAIATTVLTTAATVYTQAQQADLAEAQGKAAQTAALEKQNAANNAATQLEQNAGQQRAAAQRAAIQQRAQGALVQSRANALAASSGGSASDPGVINVTGQIGAKSEYNALSELYSGETQAQGNEYQAKVDRTTGQQYAAAGAFDKGVGDFRAGLFPVQAAGTIFGGASSLFAKYGSSSTSSPGGGLLNYPGSSRGALDYAGQYG